MLKIVVPAFDEDISISKFIINIFNKSISHIYNESGNEEFTNHVHPYKLEERRKDFTCYSQYLLKKEGEILGFLETRESSHITLLFIKLEDQRKGYGRILFSHAEKIAKSTGFNYITLNSSPNSVGAYERWGFQKESEENSINGIRFYKMRKRIESKTGNDVFHSPVDF